MMKKRMLGVIAVLLVCIFALSACKKEAGKPVDNAVSENTTDDSEDTDQTDDAGKYKFGFSVIDMQNPYFITLEEAVQQVVDKEECTMVVKDPSSNADTQAEQTDRKLKEKELKTLLARDEELDGLFERIYEDNVSGKLSDDRFAKMSRRYEDEQKELSEKIKKLRSEIEKQSSRSMTTDMFIGLVRKYTRARKLTPRMLNELIEKIEVFNAEKIDGVWEQRLRIHYNCVGTIEIPTVLPLPIPEVSVNTRKGVVVNYAPCELAV